MGEFNQVRYINQYAREHYSRFHVDLLKDDKEELDKMLKEDGITKADFLRNAIEEYKKKRIKKKESGK